MKEIRLAFTHKKNQIRLESLQTEVTNWTFKLFTRFKFEGHLPEVLEDLSVTGLDIESSVLNIGIYPQHDLFLKVHI